LKSSEIAPNFARFWPLKFFGDGFLKFWTCIIKRSTVQTTVQNFVTIGGRSSEIRWQSKILKNKTFAVKHKFAPKTIVSGQTN